MALSHEKILEATEHLSSWINGDKGFYSTLFELIEKADSSNMKRLHLAYPNHVFIFIQWRNSSSLVSRDRDEKQLQLLSGLSASVSVEVSSR